MDTQDLRTIQSEAIDLLSLTCLRGKWTALDHSFRAGERGVPPMARGIRLSGKRRGPRSAADCAALMRAQRVGSRASRRCSPRKLRAVVRGWFNDQPSMMLEHPSTPDDALSPPLRKPTPLPP